MIVIIGGGLSGMSAAYHLGDRSCMVLEATSEPGGLCRTRTIDGFTFDCAGHLLHLRDPRIEALIEKWLPEKFRVIERRSFVRSHGRMVPYPFQANLSRLPPDVIADCLIGFVESMGRPIPQDPATSFAQWSAAVFGKGISDAFMIPYNRKVFCRDPGEMTADWVSWAVPKPTLREIVLGAVGRDNVGMGYNAEFLYPRSGGIGVLSAALAECVGSQLRCGAEVVEVDLDGRSVVLANGEALGYEQLVATIPLPRLLAMVRGGVDGLAAEGRRLDWSVVACLNLGIDRPCVGDGAHWIYFPDEDVPFYRVGFPTNFSAAVAPPGTSSMYIEFGLRRNESREPGELEEAAIPVLIRTGVLKPSDGIVVSDATFIDPGYVIFDRARHRVLAEVAPALERLGVHLIGRYGAWTYSSMEGALLDGLELAERLRP